MTDFRVKRERIVPMAKDNLHAGKQAVLVASPDNYIAWGFGATKEQAKNEAIQKVIKLDPNL